MLETHSHPESLWLVRSTLEMTALMKQACPGCEVSLREIEAEVRGAGEMLLAAGSEPRARLALETIHRARQKLGQLHNGPDSFTA